MDTPLTSGFSASKPAAEATATMESRGSDSCLTLSDTEIETISQEELVIFDTVQTCYSNQRDIVVLYTSGTAVEHDRGHWIGLFKKGWQTTSDFALHQWVPFDPISKWQPRSRKTIFPQDEVGNLLGSFQFLYVAGEEQVLGVSETFRISDEEESPEQVTSASHLSQSLSLHNLEIPSSSSSSSSSEDPDRGEEKVEKIRSLSENALVKPLDSSTKSPALRSLLEQTSLSSITLRPCQSDFYQKLKFVTCNSDPSVTSCCEHLKDFKLEFPKSQRPLLIEELEASLQTNTSICPAFEQHTFTGAIRFHPYKTGRQPLAVSMSRENFRRSCLELYRKALSECSFSKQVSSDPFKAFAASGVKELNVWKAASSNDVKEDRFILSGLKSSLVSSKLQKSDLSRSSECTERGGESAFAGRNDIKLEKKCQDVCTTSLSSFKTKSPSENDGRASLVTTPATAKTIASSFRGTKQHKRSVVPGPEAVASSTDEVNKQQRPQSTDDVPVNNTVDDACRAVEGGLQVPDQNCVFIFSGGCSDSGSSVKQTIRQQDSIFSRTSLRGRKRTEEVVVGRAPRSKVRRAAPTKLTSWRATASISAHAKAQDKAGVCRSESAVSSAEVRERIALLDAALVEALKENADLRCRLTCIEAHVNRTKKNGASDVNVDTKPRERKASPHEARFERQNTKKTAKASKSNADKVHTSRKSHSSAPEKSARDRPVKVASPKTESKSDLSLQSSKVGSSPKGKKGASKLSEDRDDLVNNTPSDNTLAARAKTGPKSAATISIAKTTNEARKGPTDQNNQTCFCHPVTPSSGCSNSSSTDEGLEKWKVASSKQMLRLKRLVAKKKEDMTRLRESAENSERHVQDLLAQLRAVRTTLSFETRRRLAAEKDLYTIRVRFWELISARTWQAWGSFNSRILLESTARNFNLGKQTDFAETKTPATLKPLLCNAEKAKREDGWSEKSATKRHKCKENKNREMDEAMGRQEFGQHVKFDEEDEEDVLTKSVRDLRRRVSFNQFLLPQDEGMALPAKRKHGNRDLKVQTSGVKKKSSGTQVKASDAEGKPEEVHFTAAMASAMLARCRQGRIKKISRRAMLKARARLLRKKESSLLVAEALGSLGMSHLLQASSPSVEISSRSNSGSQLGSPLDASVSPGGEARSKDPQSGDSDTTDESRVATDVKDAQDEDSDNWSPQSDSAEQVAPLSDLPDVVQNNSPGVRSASDVISTQGKFRGRDSSLLKFTHNDLRQQAVSQLVVNSGARSQNPPDRIVPANPVQLSPLSLLSLLGCGKACLGGGAPSSRLITSPPRPGQAFRLISHDDVDLRKPQWHQGTSPTPRALHYDLDKTHSQSLNQQIQLGRCLTCGMRFSPTVDRLLVEQHIHFHHVFNK